MTQGGGTSPSFRVLIADDSEFARKKMNLFVSKLGGVVIGEAGNGHEAIDLYFKLRPDIVLMDITMPGMEGTEAVERIVASDPGAVIIIISALGHKSMLEKAITVGAKHFITKPIQFEYAAEIVRSVLDDRAG
jgi:two-component system chemotaxis response regulator CheY